nr:pentatricopeptide repeat-containing protein At4g01570 [Ipomoea batatas]
MIARRRLCSFSTATASNIGNLLVVASIAKALAKPGGSRNLDGNGSDSAAVPLSEDVVLQVLRRNSLDVSKRLDFFRWCSLRPGFRHSAATYSQIFKTICGCRGYHGEIFGLLDSMSRDGADLDSATFKLLLDSFIRAGKFDTALEVLDFVGSKFSDDIVRNCLSNDVYNSVLVALVHKNQVNMALSIFLKLLESSNSNNDNTNGEFVEDALACNELLVGLKRAEMRAEFKQVFDKLRERKNSFPLDRWGYNICIHTFGLWGNLATSLVLFKEMKERGNAFTPDLCTYNSLIQVLCVLGKVKDALVVWEEMKGSSGLEPDYFTYRILIQGCSRSYRVNDAMKIFSEMQYNGLCPDTIVYNSLLNGLLKARKLTDACNLFEKMIEDDGVRASCWTYNILIDGLFKNGRAVAAYTLFCDLKKKSNSFVDGISYSIVVLHLCREGGLDKAMELVEEMEARGFAVDLVTITSLLIAIYREGRWDWMERLMKHIRDKNLVPIVLRWRKSMEAMLEVRQSREKDFMPMFPYSGDFTDILRVGDSVETETEAYTSLGDDETDPWSSSPYMDLLASQASSGNFSPHMFTLSRGKRVDVHSKAGRLKEAYKFLKIMLNAGCVPNNVTDTILDFLEKEIEKVRYQKASIKGPNVDASL